MPATTPATLACMTNAHFTYFIAIDARHLLRSIMMILMPAMLPRRDDDDRAGDSEPDFPDVAP